MSERDNPDLPKKVVSINDYKSINGQRRGIESLSLTCPFRTDGSICTNFCPNYEYIMGSRFRGKLKDVNRENNPDLAEKCKLERKILVVKCKIDL